MTKDLTPDEAATVARFGIHHELDSARGAGPQRLNLNRRLSPGDSLVPTSVRGVQMLRDRITDVETELEQLRRLHEVATERTVQLAAVIEQALGELDAIEDRQPNDIDGMIYTKPWAEDIVRGAKGLRRTLSADTDAALREHDAKLVAEIATRIRANCTAPSEVVGQTDPLIGFVADWIENPPEWVKASWLEGRA